MWLRPLHLGFRLFRQLELDDSGKSGLGCLFQFVSFKDWSEKP